MPTSYGSPQGFELLPKTNVDSPVVIFAGSEYRNHNPKPEAKFPFIINT
jgi:hypothetical protein